jgi:hypothetical protein
MLFDGDDAAAMAHIRARRSIALVIAYNIKPFL